MLDQILIAFYFLRDSFMLLFFLNQEIQYSMKKEISPSSITQKGES